MASEAQDKASETPASAHEASSPAQPPPFLPGSIVSVDPLVTYSRNNLADPGGEFGLASTRPDLFRGRRALHFVGFAWTIEQPRAGMADRLARLEAELPNNRIVLVTNSERESYELARAGLPSILGSHLLLSDELLYRPMPRRDDLPVLDAVYCARFNPYKRHELATAVQRLMLIYYYTTAERTRDDESRVRKLLPNAWYAQHEMGGGKPNWLPGETIVQLMNQCSVGLCLSAAEGAMRASMEYLLCGMMVVTTDNLGGRDRYLQPPFAVHVEDDPEKVAEGVRHLLLNPIPKLAIRDHILRILAFERHNFLLNVNRFMREHFGPNAGFASLAPFFVNANIWRPIPKIVQQLTG